MVALRCITNFPIDFSAPSFVISEEYPISRGDPLEFMEACMSRKNPEQKSLEQMDPRERAIHKIKTLLTAEERIALFGDDELDWING